MYFTRNCQRGHPTPFTGAKQWGPIDSSAGECSIHFLRFVPSSPAAAVKIHIGSDSTSGTWKSSLCV